MRSCSAFVWKKSSKNLKKIVKKSNNVGVERGVATRRQMVWPMMTVTVTNFEGSTGWIVEISWASCLQAAILKNLQKCEFGAKMQHF